MRTTTLIILAIALSQLSGCSIPPSPAVSAHAAASAGDARFTSLIQGETTARANFWK